MSGKLKKQITICTKFRSRLVHSSIEWDIHCKPYLAHMPWSGLPSPRSVNSQLGLIGRLWLTKCRSFSNISMIRNVVRLSSNKSFCYKDSFNTFNRQFEGLFFPFFILFMPSRSKIWGHIILFFLLFSNSAWNLNPSNTF